MRSRMFVAVVLLAGVCISAAFGAGTSVLVRVGLQDKQATEWQGEIEVIGGKATAMRGWLFDKGDELGEDGAWKLVTDEVAEVAKPAAYANGIIVDLDGSPGTRLRISANGATWDVPVGDLKFGVPLRDAAGNLSAEIVPAYQTLSNSEREDDYPSLCAMGSETLVAVWQSYQGKEDRLYWAAVRDGVSGEPQEIPGFAGDLYQPTCAPDGEGGFWVICPRQENGDFDLWAMRYDGSNWSKPGNITGQQGNDFGQVMCTGADGGVYCVWQGYRDGSSDILMSRCVDGKWSRPDVVAASPGNEWAPAIASGQAGTWVAWDTYVNGSYDIYAARLVDGKPEAARPIAVGPRFEAKPSIACDPSGRVFIAWQDAGEDWGKDTGYTVPNDLRRQSIYRERDIKVVCLEGDRLLSVADVALSMPQGERRFLEEPRIACDASGRLWMVMRHPLITRRPRGKKVFTEKAWENYATYLSGDAWAPAMYFPDKLSRVDTFPALAPTRDSIAVAFHTDGREYPSIRNMTRNKVFITSLPVPGQPVPPQLAQMPQPTPQVVREDEAAQVRRARDFVVDVAGKALRILRGDTHRHTEISWDGTGDGSVLDAYRYAMDAVGLDFFMVSDHNQQTGVDLEYIWWRNYKIADVFNNPPVFNTLFGYERSLGFPNGHRNIINADRDHPSFPFTGQTDDLKLLYEYCRREGAIVIAHTSGSNHGTNWPYFDPLLEPVIEIFQGCRTSFEYEGAPKSATPGDRQAQNTGYQPEGFLWRAWQRKLRLGIISSSDHGSTHYSYAGVYCEEPSRQGVINGISSRRTFGATDNIIVKMACGDHFMGDEWKQAQAPVLDIEIVGTGPLTRVEIIKDFEFVYTDTPDGSTAKLRWMDNDFTEGTHLYYVRAQQADTSIAWGSPVWITKG